MKGGIQLDKLEAEGWQVKSILGRGMCRNIEAFKECGIFGDLQESWYDRMGCRG